MSRATHMLISNYYRRILLACVVMLVFIVGLSVVLFTQGPRVRLVQFSQDLTETSLTDSSTVTIVFDRPLEDQDYSRYIAIEPAVDFEAKTGVQNIVLTLNENISRDQEYTVTVQPEIFDQSGKKMQRQYQHSFVSATPRYAYLERNYQVNDDQTLFGAAEDDRVLLATVGSDLVDEVVFENPEIRSFAANRDYVAVIVKEESTDAIYTVDLASNEVRREQLLIDGRINNVSLGQRGQVLLYTIQPDFDSVDSIFFFEVNDRIESLDLATGEITPVVDQSGDSVRALSIELDNNGQVALTQDLEGTYFAVSPFNDFDPILVGSYSGTFGFNANTTEILFRDREDFISYDIASSELSSLQVTGVGIVQELSAENGPLFASHTTRFSSTSRSHIDRYSLDGSQTEEVWSRQGDGLVLRGFKESHDGSLLAIEQNPEQCLFDDIGVNSKCSLAATTIFDTDNQQTIDEFSGFDLVWIP